MRKVHNKWLMYSIYETYEDMISIKELYHIIYHMYDHFNIQGT